MSDTKKQLQDMVAGIRDELESEDLNPYEWLEECLCVESVMKSPSGDFQGIEITVAFGGPTVKVDTRRSVIEGGWGFDSVNASFSDGGKLNDAAEELFGYQ